MMEIRPKKIGSKVSKYCNSTCKILGESGIPMEPRWIGLIDFMRNLGKESEISLSLKQKNEIHSLLEFLEKKDYSDGKYKEINKRIEEIKHAPCWEREGKLTEALKSVGKEKEKLLAEMAAIVELSQELGGKHITDVKKLGDIAEDIFSGKRDKAETVMEFRNNLKAVLTGMAEEIEKWKGKSKIDKLTNLYNRGAFDEHIEKTVLEYKKTGNPVSLLMIDIDHFKNINDAYGHRTGDQVLVAVARNNIKGNSRRAYDFPARYGGEEFAVIYSDLNIKLALERAEAIRKSVEDHQFAIRKLEKDIPVTVSVGVAEMQPEWRGLRDADMVQRIVEGADKALYQAKHDGRNRVRWYN